MKKMLIMAMAVFALMACKKSSDTGLPKGEAKALETTTVGAIDVLGESPNQVDAALTKAGFKKIKGTLPLSAPARATIKKMPAAKNEAATVTVNYAYGLPDNYDTMTEEQALAWLNNALAKGDALMIVTTTFVSDKLMSMYTIFLIQKSSKANKTFTATSDNMYKQLPSGANNHYWVGLIAENDIDEENYEGVDYTDHSAFVSKVAKAEGITAEEEGIAMTKGYYYGNVWFNPSELEEREMMNNGFSQPYCMGGYVVANGGMD